MTTTVKPKTSFAWKALTTQEAAEALSISISHFRDMDKAGTLGPEPVRMGRSVRWRGEELKAWIDAGCPKREQWQKARSRGVA